MPIWKQHGFVVTVHAVTAHGLGRENMKKTLGVAYKAKDGQERNIPVINTFQCLEVVSYFKCFENLN